MGRAVAFSRFHPRRAPRFAMAFFAADSLRIENTAVHPTRHFVLLLLFFYAVPVGHPAQEPVAAERECRQKACFIFDNKIQNQ